jgi:hypothetical protein
MNLSIINKALYHKNNKSLYIINAQNNMCKKNDFTSTSPFTPNFKCSNTNKYHNMFFITTFITLPNSFIIASYIL